MAVQARPRHQRAVEVQPAPLHALLVKERRHGEPRSGRRRGVHVEVQAQPTGDHQVDV
ncbi:hypothetical protein LINPERHAP1_LOCUS26949 [Linum perenne]